MKSARLFLTVLAFAVSCFLAASSPADDEPTTPPAATESHPSLLRGAWDWFHKGGVIMYPIALTSFVGLAFALERTVALRRKAAVPDALKQELIRRLDELDVAGAIAACEQNPSSLARVTQPALLRQAGSILEMEKAAEDAGVRELWQMRRNVRPVGVVASVAPLLGLLGTISGMIGAFKTMSTGDTMGNPSAFASDIHEALFTTFFGLSIAIPMLLCYHWLHGKAEAIMCEIEETVGNLLLRLRDRRLVVDPAAPGEPASLPGGSSD